MKKFKLFFILVYILFTFSLTFLLSWPSLTYANQDLDQNQDQDQDQIQNIHFPIIGVSFVSDIEKEKVIKILDAILGKTWTNKWKLLRENKNPLMSVYKIIIVDNNYLKVEEVWNLIHILANNSYDTSIFRDIEIETQADETINKFIKDNQQKNMVLKNVDCDQVTEDQVANNPKYFTCDTLWSLKNIGALQLDDEGEWSDQWIEKLMVEKKNQYEVEKNILIKEGNYQQAEKVQSYINEMKSKGDGVLIGHPDTGFTWHPEIAANEKVDAPEGFTFDGSTGYDYMQGPMISGHGTGTASSLVSPPYRQIEGDANNGSENFYSQAVALKARIRPYRVALFSPIHMTFKELIKAFESIVENNKKYTRPEDYHKRVRVVSMSLGGPFPNTKLHRLMKEAKKQGVIMVAASGNMIPELLFNKFVVWPAAYTEVIAAAATDVYNNPWKSSSKGKKIDISAPGNAVWSAKAFRTLSKVIYSVSRHSGTSYATTGIAGVAALWVGFHGESKLQEYGEYRLELFRYIMDQAARKGKLTAIKCDRITRLCDEVKRGYFGRGIINAKALLEEPLPKVEDLMTYVNKGQKEIQDVKRRYFLDDEAVTVLENINNIINFEDNNDLIVTASRINWLFNFKNKKSNKILNKFLIKFGDEFISYLSFNDDLKTKFSNFVKVRNYLISKHPNASDSELLIKAPIYKLIFKKKVRKNLAKNCSHTFATAVKL
ncbi:MAG: S8/S53 family peptidase [Oligoflexia bacterium]|nr:S8/S53 family peptidase [Oligoflexia bacterium]